MAKIGSPAIAGGAVEDTIAGHDEDEDELDKLILTQSLHLRFSTLKVLCCVAVKEKARNMSKLI